MELTKVKDSSGKEYHKTPDGTCYHIETPKPMIDQLERIRASQERCRFHWGDIATGRDWGDIWDIKGRIGRTTGKFHAPILIYNRRSRGGGMILTHCIVKITATKGGRAIYQHPKYHKD